MKTPIITLKLHTKNLLLVETVITVEISDLTKITSLPTGMTSMFNHHATNRTNNSAKKMKAATSLTKICVETDAVVVALKTIKREETTALVNTNLIKIVTTNQIKGTKTTLTTPTPWVREEERACVEVSKTAVDSVVLEEDLLIEVDTEATAADSVEEKEEASKCVAEETTTTDQVVENKKMNQKNDHRSPSSSTEEETSAMCSKRSAKRKTVSLGL